VSLNEILLPSRLYLTSFQQQWKSRPNGHSIAVKPKPDKDKPLLAIQWTMNVEDCMLDKLEHVQVGIQVFTAVLVIKAN
jgi:hypothetical protein